MGSSPFLSGEGMRQAFVEAWRQTVDKTDFVTCVGHVTVRSTSAAVGEPLTALPGDGRVVVGRRPLHSRAKWRRFQTCGRLA